MGLGGTKSYKNDININKHKICIDYCELIYPYRLFNIPCWLSFIGHDVLYWLFPFVAGSVFSGDGVPKARFSKNCT